MLDFNKINENIANLSKQLEELNGLTNQAYSNLSGEQYEKVKQHQIDVNKMLKAFKDGDTNALDGLIKKYSK